MTKKCSHCGHSFEKEYCKCKNLTIFDLLYAFDGKDFKDYCRKCNKEIKRIKVELILDSPLGK